MPPLFELAILHVLLGHDIRQSLESTYHVWLKTCISIVYSSPFHLYHTRFRGRPQPNPVGNLGILLDECKNHNIKMGGATILSTTPCGPL